MNQAEGEVNEDQHENQLAILEKSPAGGWRRMFVWCHRLRGSPVIWENFVSYFSKPSLNEHNFSCFQPFAAGARSLSNKIFWLTTRLFTQDDRRVSRW